MENVEKLACLQDDTYDDSRETTTKALVRHNVTGTNVPQDHNTKATSNIPADTHGNTRESVARKATLWEIKTVDAGRAM
jgi:hypothetical protein